MSQTELKFLRDIFIDPQAAAFRIRFIAGKRGDTSGKPVSEGRNFG